MKRILTLLAAVCAPLASQADTAFGDLNNFDVINDTGSKCYGFEIEIENVRSSEITYTYDWNHYGAPRITQDDTHPAGPRVRVRYESRRQADGSFASFTNPQDAVNPLSPTDGHACTDPSVNLGCEHFGVGYYGSPGVIRYFWLVEDATAPGTLVRGPLVNVATPRFVYLPPVNVGAPAELVVVVEPPEDPEAAPSQYGTPIWVKILKTVQKSGKKVKLIDLLTDDETRDDDTDWAGEEEVETEIEWTLFQKAPLDKEDEVADELEGRDELPEGDETVTRRYEFYTYAGTVDPEDGEADCDDAEECPEAVGAYIGAQMAAFNVGAPLGLIDHLQDGERGTPYVDRSVIVGGNAPYIIEINGGALPLGMTLDPLTGILSGTPTESGDFHFTVDVLDSSAVVEAQTFTLHVAEPLQIGSSVLPHAQEGKAFDFEFAPSGGVGPYFWSAEGLPAGLNLSTAGLLTGTPESGTQGSVTLVVTLMDSRSVSTSTSLTLVVDPVAALRGDVDGDRDIDGNDLALILAARNKRATGPQDPRDLDKDGFITVRDARVLVNLFSAPR